MKMIYMVLLGLVVGCAAEAAPEPVGAEQAAAIGKSAETIRWMGFDWNVEMTFAEGTMKKLVRDEWPAVQVSRMQRSSESDLCYDTECLNPTNGEWIQHGLSQRIHSDGTCDFTLWYHGDSANGEIVSLPMQGAPLVTSEDVRRKLD